MATKKPSPAFMSDQQGAGLNQDVFDAIIAESRIPAAPEQEKTGMVRRIAGDGILTGLKGAIGVPEAAVGLADLATGGAAGKLAEDAGFRPKEAKAMLDEYYSPEQKAAFSAVQNAANPNDPMLTRMGDIAGAAIRNPSTIVHSVGESLPLMGAGGVIGRGVMAMAPKAAAWAAGGIGEGVTQMGSGAEQMRQSTKDGYLTGQQSLVAAGSGALTGAFGMLAGKVADKLGIGDVHTLLAGGDHVPPALQKNFVRKMLEGAVSEGILEELPQSVQEQMAQNYALGKPLDEGVDNAAVMGVLTGGAMGVGAQGFHGRAKVPEVGPLSRGANLAGGVPPVAPMPTPPAGAAPAAGAPVSPGAVPDPIAEAQALIDAGIAQGVQEKAAQRAAMGVTAEGSVSNGTLDAAAQPVEELPPEAPAVLGKPSAEAHALREQDRPVEPTNPVLDGDILNSQGKPFTTMPGAITAQKRAGDTHEIVRVAGGLVVRQKATTDGNTNTLAELGSTTADGSGDNAQSSNGIALDVASNSGDGTGNVTTPADGANQTVAPVLDAGNGAPELAPSGNVTTPDGHIRDEKGNWADPKTVYTDMLANGWKAVEPKAGSNMELRKDGETPVSVTNSHADMVRTLANADPVNAGWDSMPNAERNALASKTGMAKAIADKIASKPWAEITAKTRARIEAVMAAPASDAKDAPKKKLDRTRAARLSAYDKNPLVSFLGTHGLYHDKDQPGSLKSEFSPDKKIMVPGHGPVFRKTGKRLDALVQNAIEGGYLPKDGTEQQLYSLIQRAVAGEKITPKYAEGVAEQEAQAQMDARAQLEQEQYGADNSEPATADEIEAALDAEMEASDAAFFAVDDSDIPWDAPGNSSTEAFLRAMGATEQEIRDGLAQEQNGQSRSNQAGAGTQEAITGAAQAGNGGRSPQAGDSVAPRSGTGDSEGLTAPTRGDVLAQQERADKAAKADAKAKTDAANKAKADAERNEFTLTGSDRPADVGAAGGQQGLLSDKPAASANTIFTEDAAAKARAILKAKLRNLNTGLDPEMMQAGITLAGYHIEKGARTFAAYAKAMLADLGDGVKPYLKSWYLGVRFDPRAGKFDGMDTAAAVESAAIDTLATDEPATPAKAETTPAMVEHVTGKGQPAAQVEALVKQIAARWVNAPKVVVVQSLDDPRVPANIAKEAQGFADTATNDKAGGVEGFIEKGTNTVFLIADTMPTDLAVVKTLMHEILGHYGLRVAFGTELGTILDRMAVLNADKVRNAAKRLDLDFETEDGRRMAAEEVLAYMAQNTPELGWVKAAVAAVRSWARKHIPGFTNMRMSDDELIRNFIIPARDWVEKGGPDGGGGGNVTTSKADSTGNVTSNAAYSRSLGAALTSSINSAREVNLPAGYQLADLFQGEGRLSYWHKSVGTMYNLAQKSAPFKRVYDSVQNFLNDVSYYAAESADLAPTILPKLDKFGDVFKSPLSPQDTKALSAPVFEGTLAWGRNKQGVAMPSDDIETELGATSLDDKAHMLMRAGNIDPKVLKMWQGLPMDQYENIINGKFEKELMKPGVVFTPAELKEHFKMTDAQVKLYQEFRSATDKSIDNLAISEMLNYAGKDADPIRDQVLASDSVSEAGQTMRDYLVSLTELEPNRDEVLSATAAKMLDIAAHAQDMKDRGYAPLSRFGTYTLEATLATGERYFSLFETDRERNKAARMLLGENATDVKTGTMSQESYKLLNGVSPETAALFGEMLGLDSTGNEAKDLAFQEFIKRGTANRSAMKRLLKRKGIAGFSDDSGRVLAGFLYSNARRTASNLHTKETSQAVSDIPKEQGELKDTAVKLQEYVSNPAEEAQAFRGILFAQYLGGSVASAMVNATQPFTTTLPYLSQFGGIRKAGAQMLAAVRDANKKTTGDVRLDAALKKAEEVGIVSPQEVHQLMAQARGQSSLMSGDGTMAGNSLAKAGNALSKLSMAWGKVFSVAEQFNRRTTFIAAYRTAIEQGIADPAKFAEKAVNETQFVSNKGNKPRWARGVVGSVLFTFKSYSVNYLELVTRMATAGEPGSAERKAGQKAAVLAIAILFMMAGSEGLPFVEDIEDVIDGAMQRLGYNFSSKQQMKTFLTLQLGKDGAEFVTSGLSGLPGSPIDVSGRLGMGNLLPGTGLFQKKADHTRDLMELAGPGGDFVKRAFGATEQALGGNVTSALNTIAPKAAQNVSKAMDMNGTGMYRDGKGRKIIDTTGGEAFAKAIGFQPRSVKNVQEASMEVQRAKSGYTLASSEIRDKMAQAIFMDDSEMKQRARDALSAWNEQNPDQRMTLNMPAILHRVREMRKSKEQRIADTAPKAVRAQVRAQLREELH